MLGKTPSSCNRIVGVYCSCWKLYSFYSFLLTLVRGFFHLCPEGGRIANFFEFLKIMLDYIILSTSVFLGGRPVNPSS